MADDADKVETGTASDDVPMRCDLCTFSELTTLDPSSLQKQRLCRRFPPAPVLVPVAAGGQRGLGLQALSPPVRDDGFCYEFEPRTEPEIEPTGLI